MDNMFYALWKLVERMAENVSLVWDWLNRPLKLGFNFPLLGFIGWDSFVPIQALGVGILGLLLLWAIKSLLPLG